MCLNKFTGESFRAIQEALSKGNSLKAINVFVDALHECIGESANVVGKENQYFQFLMGPIIAEMFDSTPEADRPCPFLNAYIQSSDVANQLFVMKGSSEEVGPIERLIGPFNEVFDPSKIELAIGDQSLCKNDRIPKRFRDALWLRCATRMLVHGTSKHSDNSNKLAANIGKLLDQYRILFSTSVWQDPTQRFLTNQPTSAMRELLDSAKKVAKPIHEALQSATKERKLSHRDPAVAFLTETMLIAISDQTQIVSKPVGCTWEVGDTWILLGAASQGDAGGTGMVLKLRIRKARLHDSADHCAAACYPDPEYNAYNFVDPNFQRAIRNGWIVAMLYDSVNDDQQTQILRTTDFKWRVTAYDISDHLDFSQWRCKPLDCFNDNGCDRRSAVQHACESGW